ncbi:MAG: delta-class carbonic anhydrase [Granulosicoccaceae bacterium]
MLLSVSSRCFSFFKKLSFLGKFGSCMMHKKPLSLIIGALALAGCANTGGIEKTIRSMTEKSHESETHAPVSDETVALQREALAKNTQGKGFGPQAPRDIGSYPGSNTLAFNTAPASKKMNLCNIHFHKNAEHKGGEFTEYAGNGDGHGYLSGYKYNGRLSSAESTPIEAEVCSSEHGGLSVGDTIEVHYVHSTAVVSPGPTLGSCLSDAIKNPQLRVEAQVYVLVNDDQALNFTELAKHGVQSNRQQALNMPSNLGSPVQYAGSTTGPGYNETGSPFQVTWSVHPRVAKVDIKSVGQWCKGNVFDEDHAHGVRNLVKNPDLLSPISRN